MVRCLFQCVPSSIPLPPGLEGTARPNSRAGRGPGSGQGGDLGAVRKTDALPDAEEEAVGLDLVAFAFVNYLILRSQKLKNEKLFTGNILQDKY